MTDEDREKLEYCVRICHKLDSGFFSADRGELPFIERVNNVVLIYERTSWFTRILLWVLGFIAAFSTAMAAVKGWLPK